MVPLIMAGGFHLADLTLGEEEREMEEGEEREELEGRNEEEEELDEK